MSHSYSKVFGALALLGLAVSCRANSPPMVSTGPRPSPQVVSAGGEVSFVFEVEDPDGDAMSFEWRQMPEQPAGRFSDPAARNPTWVAPDVSDTTTFAIMVIVEDSEGDAIVAQGPGVIVHAAASQAP
ncbi:hypothetical protein [Corallococcus macrosporus]|uniref:hypothetical protein n=1 Tax=Corallococcus macrosporus TaxID=35 RepID=UPI001EE654E9|nr:hypothetical protein [Corallococcus macrosporus]